MIFYTLSRGIASLDPGLISGSPSGCFNGRWRGADNLPAASAVGFRLTENNNKTKLNYGTKR
jgi:hypothetical protein